jgi:hypothetical protein
MAQVRIKLRIRTLNAEIPPPSESKSPVECKIPDSDHKSPNLCSSTLQPLPKVIDRVINSWYIYQQSPARWDGKYLKCQHDRITSKCRECGGISICFHGRAKSQCKECGGASICVHGRQRNYCKECGGASICVHNKKRSYCKECGGASFCVHDRVKSQCKECEGSAICLHDRQRSHCKDCKGTAICVHNTQKSHCKQCGGSSLCSHGIQRHVCRECQGVSICVHNRVKYGCKECGGTAICSHSNFKRICRECHGTSICEHNIQKTTCKECFVSPHNFCEICKAVCVVKNSRRYPLCYRCYCITHPDEPIPSRFKMKEHYITDYIRAYCPQYDFVYDKAIEGGCSRKRPDVLLDCMTHSIIIEVDENQHEDYKCEDKRTMQIFMDLGDRPLVVLRFNPDKYIDIDGQEHPTLFTFDQAGVIQILSVINLHQRVTALVDRIRHHVENIPDKEVTLEKLYYDFQ